MKLILIFISSLLLLSGCNSEPTSFPAPPTPPDVAPPFDEELAAQELNDENAANTDQHSDDELTEFEPGLGTDSAALKSAFFTGSEDLCAAVFAQLSGAAAISNRTVSISWCREIARGLSVPPSALDEAVAHAAGWNETRKAIFGGQSQLCNAGRCVAAANFPYPF